MIKAISAKILTRQNNSNKRRLIFNDNDNANRQPDQFVKKIVYE